jgi:Mor family transcriptional regulator
MSNKALYRKMSRDGNNAPDNMKHFALSEANIEQLLRKSEPL